MANKIEIVVVYDGKNVKAGIKGTSSEIKKLGSATEQAGKKTGIFGKSLSLLKKALPVVGIGVVVAKLVSFGIESFKAAAAAERLGTATNNLAQAIGSSGNAMVEAITSASMETISRTDAMTAANKALMFDLVKNSDQMAELTKIAITLGAAMGQDATKSLSDMTTALGRQSPLILDNLGLIVDLEAETKKYAEANDKSVDSLTELERKQVFVNAALEQGRLKVAELGGVTLDSGLISSVGTYDEYLDRLGQVEEASKVGAAGFAPWVRGLRLTAEEFDNLKKAAEKAEEAFAVEKYSSMYAESMRIITESEKERVEALVTGAQRYIEIAQDEAAARYEVGQSYLAEIELAKEAAAVRRSLAGEQANFILDLRDLNDQRLDDASDFYSQLAEIQGSAEEKSKEAATSLSDELEKIEQDKADKLHWVMTGAHARTAEENAAALAFHSAHYDELKATAIAKTKEKTDAILSEQSRAEAAAATAREKELADYQEHLNKLKIQTTLSMLETSGQLEQLTGLVGISASEAADLINAGLIPVTQDLAAAMQDTMVGLEDSLDSASATAATNQEIIQEAMEGTLDSAEEMGTGTNEALGLMNTGFGEDLPTSAAAAATATDLFTTTAAEQMGTLMEDGILPFEEELDIISDETIPTLEEAYLQAMILMTEATQLLVDKVRELETSIIAAATAAIQMGKDIEEGMKKAVEGFEKAADSLKDYLFPAIKKAIEYLNKMRDSALEAADAVLSTGEALPTGGEGGGAPGPSGFQHGTPPGGFLVPGSFGIDEFVARFSGGERIFAYPNGGGGQTVNNYYFNQTVNTRATTGTTLHDYETAIALIGA